MAARKVSQNQRVLSQRVLSLEAEAAVAATVAVTFLVPFQILTIAKEANVMTKRPYLDIR